MTKMVIYHALQAYIYVYLYIYIAGACLFVCLFVCLSVCSRLNHALMAALIEFIFCMYIGVVPRSNIGILEFSNLIIKDHLWTR